jgi:hypothetical protein
MNNKIKKFQLGGPVVLQYKEPEVYIEEALVQSIQQYKARLESERKQEQFDKEIAIQEEQFSRELKFREDKSIREAQQARHDAGKLEEAQKRGDALALYSAGLNMEDELSWFIQYDKKSKNIPILQEKIRTKKMVGRELQVFSTMATEEFSPSRLNDILTQIKAPLSKWSSEKWAQSQLDDIKNIRNNMTSQSILNKLGQNPDFKRVVGDILPSYDMSNASAVLASVPAMWTMFSGTNKEKISALKSMLPYAGKLAEQGMIPESEALHNSIANHIGILLGLVEERVSSVKDFVPQKPEFQVKEGAEYIITDPTGKSFFGTSSQARLIGRPGLEKGEKREVQRFGFTKTRPDLSPSRLFESIWHKERTLRQDIFFPGDPGYDDWQAAINKHKQMLVGEPGYVEVIDSKGNEYTWMGQDIVDGKNKKRFNVHTLKSSSGKEIKIRNEDLVENYRKLIIKSPDIAIDNDFWNRLNDTERSKFMSNWNGISVDDRPEFLNVWNKLTDAKKISIIDSM